MEKELGRTVKEIDEGVHMRRRIGNGGGDDYGGIFVGEAALGVGVAGICRRRATRVNAQMMPAAVDGEGGFAVRVGSRNREEYRNEAFKLIWHSN